MPLRSLRTNRQFEPELKLLTVLLDNESSVCLDIGAHIGQYCYMMEQAVGSAQVHAFEPNLDSCEGLRALFPEIHVWPLAISDRTGSADFKIPMIHRSSKRTRGTLEHFAEPGESGSEITQVETARLDDLRERIGPGPIALIKVDVEGHERKVLTGATETILRHRPILLVEIEQRHHEEPIREIFREAEAHGYSGCYFDLAECRFCPLDRFDASELQRYENLKSAGYVNNFLFLPNGRAEDVSRRLDAFAWEQRQ